MTASRAWTCAPRHRLPRTITPFAWEAASSYTARLAHANHISVNTLRGNVSESCGARPRPDWLATVSGQPEQVIRARLRGLAGDPVALKQNLHRPLCQRCMARRGIHEPVNCFLPAHVTVCHRHRRWVGPPVHVVDDQVDLQDRPQVLRAAHTHHRLAHQHAEDDLRAALGDARHMLVYWAHSEHRVTAGILQSGLHAYVSAYPELIAIAATLLTIGPQVEHPGMSTPSGSVAVLIARINERTGGHHTESTPVEQWVQNRRLVTTTRSAPSQGIHDGETHNANEGADGVPAIGVESIERHSPEQ